LLQCSHASLGYSLRLDDFLAHQLYFDTIIDYNLQKTVFELQ
jgi:hypothetical protein